MKLQRPDVVAAESAFLRAIEIARGQRTAAGLGGRALMKILRSLSIWCAHMALAALSRGAIFVTKHARRFPPPWTVEESDRYFIVTDSAGQKVASVYFDDLRAAAKPLTRDEAGRIASNIAKLPDLLKRA